MSVMRKLRREDSGFTLIELLVAMGIFSVLIVIYTTGIAQMSKDTVRVQNTGNNAQDTRRAFNLLDKQVRYASDMNTPTAVGNNWYLEFRTAAQPAPGSTPVCTQWRFNGTTDRVDFRTWPDVAAPTPSGWRVAASYVTNNPSSEQPFTLTTANGTYTHMQLAVYLKVQRGQTPPSTLRSSFVARNTTPNATTTPTNALTAAGVTSNPVCTQAGRP